jgi:hypothetical protein
MASERFDFLALCNPLFLRDASGVVKNNFELDGLTGRRRPAYPMRKFNG